MLSNLLQTWQLIKIECPCNTIVYHTLQGTKSLIFITKLDDNKKGLVLQASYWPLDPD